MSSRPLFFICGRVLFWPLHFVPTAHRCLFHSFLMCSSSSIYHHFDTTNRLVIFRCFYQGLIVDLDRRIFIKHNCVVKLQSLIKRSYLSAPKTPKSIPKSQVSTSWVLHKKSQWFYRFLAHQRLQFLGLAMRLSQGKPEGSEIHTDTGFKGTLYYWHYHNSKRSYGHIFYGVKGFEGRRQSGIKMF